MISDFMETMEMEKSETLEDTEARLNEQLKKIQLAKKMRGSVERNEVLDEVRSELKAIKSELLEHRYGEDLDALKQQLTNVEDMLATIQNNVIRRKENLVSQFLNLNTLLLLANLLLIFLVLLK